MASLKLGARVYDIELAFMDCDGIIFDVNAAKSDAFYKALAGYPEAARRALVTHHQAFGGISRYDKFAHFFRHIHPLENADEAAQQALTSYAEHSRRGYAPLQPNPHALRFARHFGEGRATYVVSGSDQQELRQVFAHKKIDTLFAGVCGSPTRKPEHLQRLLAHHGVSAEHALMLGDGRADFEAASTLGVPFVFLAEMSEWRDAKKLLGPALKQNRAHWFDTWEQLIQQLR